MPARTRNPRKKEEPVTTIESEPATAETAEPAPADAATTDAAATDAAKEGRKHVKPEAAVFLTDFATFAPPPELRQRNVTYVRAAGYDDGMDASWKRYVDAGSPHWSMTGSLTKDDEPEGGWWGQRDDIWLTAVVPNITDARALVRRAAKRIGCSSRFLSKEEGDGFRVWFTAAPLNKNKPKNADGTPNTDDDDDNDGEND